MSDDFASILSRPADEFVNDPTIEQLWASKTVEHMQVYFNLISSLPSLKQLKLTKNDDVIYKMFREKFSDLQIENLLEETLKNDEAKSKWRLFCEEIKNLVEDYNFATMLRLDSKEDYSENNSIVVPRAQFLAIEIARNREGHNDSLYNKYSNAS